MAANKMSSHDKKDLDKFTKYLVYKCIQIIVQARLGEKKISQSKPTASGDWFNLALMELPEVTAETKKICTSSRLLFDNTINVETSLKTSEGENMILEVWSLSTNLELCDNARVSYTVYNRMSVLLKSLLCVSRVTPAYKLSRNQGSETYVVCYRIYSGEPVTAYLGTGATSRRVGAVPTPCGTIELMLSYRTKIMFSPHQSTLSIDLKDDHFTEVQNPSNCPRPCKAPSRRPSSSVTPDSEYEQCATVFSTSPVSPYRSPSRQRKKSSASLSGGHHQLNGDAAATAVTNGHGGGGGFDNVEKKSMHTAGVGAFAPTITEQPKVDDDIPFANLLQRATDANANKEDAAGSSRQDEEPHRAVQAAEDAVDNDATQQHGRWWRQRRRHASAESGSNGQHTEDFVMVELKTPFAGHDGASELGRFYRECQGAPPLHHRHHHSCHSALSLHQQQEEDPADSKHFLNSITDQLSHFEEQSHDFDDFINGLLIGDE